MGDAIDAIDPRKQPLALDVVRARLPEDARPSLRKLRETMDALDCIIKLGRSSFTTEELWERFLCRLKVTEQSAQISSPIAAAGNGTRGVGSRSGSQTVQSPEDELNEALKLVAKATARHTAEISPPASRRGRSPSKSLSLLPAP